MKTFIFTIFLAFLFIFPTQRAEAVDYKIANQMTLEWAITAPNNAGEQIEYAIYIAPSDDKGSSTKLWQGPETEYTVTMTNEGLFLFGLQTIRRVDVDGTFETVSTAEIGWSDDPLVAPVPFGIRHYTPPAMGGGFGPK
jgi:hypothetical protein